MADFVDRDVLLHALALTFVHELKDCGPGLEVCDRRVEKLSVKHLVRAVQFEIP